jgi:hypothetical protein
MNWRARNSVVRNIAVSALANVSAFDMTVPTSAASARQLACVLATDIVELPLGEAASPGLPRFLENFQ